MSRRALILLVVIAVAIAAGALLMHNTMSYGFSAHDDPTRIESMMASMMRHYSAPADLRSRRNPIPLTPQILTEARAHYADHCATCHGNDGKGKTEMGPHFYPKVPDMTLASTQSQADGELFATIENGVRMSGMPGWGDGTAESARGSWTLVHFIRHLPKITPDELAQMEKLNPKTPDDMEESTKEDEFLQGGDAAPAEAQHHH